MVLLAESPGKLESGGGAFVLHRPGQDRLVVTTTVNRMIRVGRLKREQGTVIVTSTGKEALSGA